MTEEAGGDKFRLRQGECHPHSHPLEDSELTGLHPLTRLEAAVLPLLLVSLEAEEEEVVELVVAVVVV